jgi:predicted glycoside hydrolase/deacetylase ChbG (UPF0249 family)
MNPILRRLGFGPTDRVAIVHADDFGMCQATIPAIADLFDAGLVTSAAVMVPCPWFNAAAALCRSRSDLDIGVHTTLNCEWGSYRWGALSTSDPATGLIDSEGAMPHTVAELDRADHAAVACELQAQAERAQHAGIDITHIDAHMGAAFQPPFLPHYIALGQHYRVPTMVPRLNAEQLRQRGTPNEQIPQLLRFQSELEEQGLPLIDHLTWMDLRMVEDRGAMARHVFDTLVPGLNYVILHPATDTPELRAIAPDWQARVGDYETFLRADLKAYVAERGIYTIGYRAIRDAMRAGV